MRTRQSAVTGMGRYIFAGDGSVIVERRMAPRYELEIGLTVEYPDGATVIGRTTNVSESGLQVVVPTPTATGTVLGFACPTFKGTARVAWSREDGGECRLGLTFVSVAPPDREALVELLVSTRRTQAPLAERAGG